MKKLIKTFTYGLIATILFGVGVTYAQSVSVQFQNTPLFSEANFLPQDSVTRFVKAVNNTDAVTSSSVRATNVSNSGLGDFINLKIKSGNTTFFDGTMTEFFDKSSVSLSQLPVGQEVKFDFIATFLPTEDNNYQEESISFNLQFIFEGGQVVDDTTTSFGEGISSGGGGGNGPVIGAKNLIISNEIVGSLNPPQPNSVLVTWLTNIPATSQVIYGPESGGPYNLNLSESNYGYPFATVEDTNKTTNHSVIISNLVPLQVYSMRVVSKASPPTVGYEYLFSIDQSGQVSAVGNINGTLIAQNYTSSQNNNPVANPNNVIRTIAAAGATSTVDIEINEEDQNSTNTENQDPNSENQTANVVFGSNFINWKTGLWIFGIILLLFLLILFLRRRDKEGGK